MGHAKREEPPHRVTWSAQESRACVPAKGSVWVFSILNVLCRSRSDSSIGALPVAKVSAAIITCRASLPPTGVSENSWRFLPDFVRFCIFRDFALLESLYGLNLGAHAA
eukprot:scaffold260757_cov35-Tisochrysis_lutea.AAC.1